MTRFLTLALAATTLAASLAMPAVAEYPERPVTFIVPWPPGDLEDQLTRVIVDEFTAKAGAPAKVVNRPGGGAVEGATAVAQSDPDGYTVGSLVIDVPTTPLGGAEMLVRTRSGAGASVTVIAALRAALLSSAPGSVAWLLTSATTKM